MGGMIGYTVCLIIISSLLVGAFIYTMFRIKDRKPAGGKSEVIDNGNVSILFDRNNNVTIIPFAKNAAGVGKAIAAPVLLNSPYDAVKLGQAVRHAMETCKAGTECTDVELMSRLNAGGWKEFSEGKRNISVFYVKGHGVVINTTRRRLDGSYQFNYFGFEKVISNTITDGELGQEILICLNKCR